MASKRIEMCLVIVLVLVLWNGAKAQSAGCTNTLMGLSPCLSYVTGNSSAPSPTCCTQLASVVQSTPQCLCSLTNGAGNNMGININQTLALTLPGACNVQTPAISQCNAVANGPASSPVSPAAAPALAPATSPAGSTTDTSNTTPENPTTTPTLPSGGTSKTVPTIPGSTSDGNLKKPALFLFLVALVSTFVKF